ATHALAAPLTSGPPSPEQADVPLVRFYWCWSPTSCMAAGSAVSLSLLGRPVSGLPADSAERIDLGGRGAAEGADRGPPPGTSDHARFHYVQPVEEPGDQLGATQAVRLRAALVVVFLGSLALAAVDDVGTVAEHQKTT